ncbi:MAG: hypothetical protein AAGF23_17280 [Acidobacteriota bacterium]
MLSSHAITAALWLLSFQLIAEYGALGRDPARLHGSAPKTVWAFLRLASIQGVFLGLALWPHLGLITVSSLSILLILQGLLRVAVRGGRGPLALHTFYRRPFSGELFFIVFLILSSLAWILAVQNFLDTSAPGIYTNENLQRTLITVAGLIVVTRGGTAWIRALLDQMGKGSSLQEHGQIDFNAGRMIGNLERILIFGMALSGHVTAIGFVLAAKSIARFKNLEADQRFAEYYLLGTLASALIALATAEAVKAGWSVIP